MLESFGWKTLRFRDYVPTSEELIQKIEEIINGLDISEEEKTKTKEACKTIQELDKYIEERYDTEKMTQMLDLCHTQNYEKMDEDSDSPNDVIVTKCGGYDELDEYGYEDDYE